MGSYLQACGKFTSKPSLSFAELGTAQLQLVLLVILVIKQSQLLVQRLVKLQAIIQFDH